MFLKEGMEACKNVEDSEELKPLQDMWNELDDLGVSDSFRNRMSDSFEDMPSCRWAGRMRYDVRTAISSCCMNPFRTLVHSAVATQGMKSTRRGWMK